MKPDYTSAIDALTEQITEELTDKLTGKIAGELRLSLHTAVDEAVDALINGDARPARTASRGRKPAARKVARKGKVSASGRLPRRSPEEILAAAQKIAGLLKKKGELRAEHIREVLDLDKRELPRVLKEGVATGLIKITGGAKRSTTYGAGSGRKPSAPRKAKKVARKASAKPRAAKAKAATKPAKKAKAGKAKVKKASAKAHVNGVSEAATPAA